MKIRTLFLAGLFVSVAFAASSFEGSSSELAKDIAPSLNGKTVAVLDFLDQQKNVRELGRVLSDQYLRVDLSKLGVKTVTRSALDRALSEIKLSQAGLTDAINGGLGNKFKTADVVITGSLSQIGDSYTASVEVIDVKTGSSLASSRSTFPKIASVQTLWDNILETPKAASSVGTTDTSSQGTGASAEGWITQDKLKARVEKCTNTTGDKPHMYCEVKFVNLDSSDLRFEVNMNNEDKSVLIDENGTSYFLEQAVISQGSRVDNSGWGSNVNLIQDVPTNITMYFPNPAKTVSKSARVLSINLTTKQTFRFKNIAIQPK
jgi:hypothetical protein